MDKKKAIQIIDELLTEVGMKAANFADAIGVSSQVIYDIQNVKKTNTISSNLAGKIVKVFPQINKYYLLTGEGSLTKMDELSDNATKQELIAAINRTTKILEVIAESVLKGKEAELKHADARLNESEASKNNSLANINISESFAKTNAMMEKLVDSLINKNNE